MGLLELPTPSKTWLGVSKLTRITYAQGTREVRTGTRRYVPVRFKYALVREGTRQYARVRAGTINQNTISKYKIKIKNQF